jgi:hypothetical protein
MIQRRGAAYHYTARICQDFFDGPAYVDILWSLWIPYSICHMFVERVG